MCDTIVALPSVTRDGKVYFAKNSDREPNEAQYLELVHGGSHDPGSEVQCTYLKIPQVDKTYTVLLSKPFWMWGAEMGVNENGVAIGNEALFTKIKPDTKPGLIGMDLLRLALERSGSAEEALHVLINLIAEFGQSGNCSFDHQLYYHNSFLIADRSNAWVLETAGEHWAALKVKDFYTISNGITIEKKWDLASNELVQFAIDKNWCKSAEDFNFKNCYSDFLYTNFSQSHRRRCDTFDYLESHIGKIDVFSLSQLLRMHSTRKRDWRPDQSFHEWTVCVHKGFGPIRASQTTGSMICRLSEDRDLHFFTGTSAPCTSMFKPVWIDLRLPTSEEPTPDNQFNSASSWWRHEIVHRKALENFPLYHSIIEQRREGIEENLLGKALLENLSSSNTRQEIENEGYALAVHLDEVLLSEFNALKNKPNQKLLHHFEWRGHNQKAGI